MLKRGHSPYFIRKALATPASYGRPGTSYKAVRRRALP
jgi:hypothetical protein